MKIILLPARMLDCEMYENQVEEFSKNHEVVVADLTLDNSIKLMSDRIIKSYLKDGEKALFIGTSMGGYVALDIVKRYPNKVRGLVLVSTNARCDSLEQKLLRLKEIKSILLDFDNIAFKMAKKIVSLNSKDEGLIEKVKKTSLKLGKMVFARQQYAIMRRENSIPYLQDILCPTLIVGGEFDQITRYDILEEMQRLIFSSKIVTIKDAGHISPSENYMEFNQVLNDFINSKLCD